MLKNESCFLLIFIVLSFLSTASAQDSNFDFRKTKWGMTISQVKAIESIKPSAVTKDKSKTLLIYKDTIAGLSCKVVYIFSQNKLIRSKYMVTKEHTNKNDYLSDYNSLSSALTEKYGPPESEDTFWENDLFKDDYSGWGTAVSVGHLSKFTEWKTQATDIILYLHGENYNINLGIEYLSVKLKSIEDEADKTEDLKKL